VLVINKIIKRRNNNMKKSIQKYLLTWLTHLPISAISLRASIALAGVDVGMSHSKCNVEG